MINQLLILFIIIIEEEDKEEYSIDIGINYHLY